MKCSRARPLLSDYVDNALSAHATWELDKHLTECGDCSTALEQMRQTVALLAAAPRLEVSPDFMAKLQSRLATVEPAPARRAWLSGLTELFRPRVLPAWGAAVAACALAVMMLVPQPQHIAPNAGVSQEPAIVQTAKNQNVELATLNPLGDASAAALMANSREAESE